MPTKEVSQQARIQTAGVVPDEWRQSLPLPRMVDGQLRLAFFFAPAVLSPQEGARLGPPDHLCVMDVGTAKLLELKAVTPADFKQADKAGEPIGSFRMPEGLTPFEFVEKLDRLFSLYDQLLPTFAQGRTGDSDLEKTVAEFNELFRLLSEPPFQPYYEEGAKDFHVWLRRAKPQ